MKHSTRTRILTACFSSSILIALPGCERALEVVDQLGPDTPGSQPPPGSQVPNTPPVPNAACACASSPSLLALTCGEGEVPLYENDIVQTTPDGSVVAFDRCPPGQFWPCEVVRWDGRESVAVAQGSLVGLDDTGEHLLVTTGFLTRVDVGGDVTELPMGMFIGRNLLSATGELAFGTTPGPVERAERLARSNAAGEIEVLGDVSGSVATAYANPAGTVLVGFAIGENDVDGVFTGFVYQPFRWSAETGLRFDFPGVPEGVTIWPESVSDDGSVIAGRALPDQVNFIWSEAGGYTELGRASWASETSISGDGSAVLGSFLPGDLRGTSAFRSTVEPGVVDDLSPRTSSIALDISTDGSVAVAYSWEPEQADGAPPEHTFVWDTEHGGRTLADLLAARGVDTSGWELGVPRKLSDDGRVLLGLATCGGEPTLYRAVLSD